MCPGWHFFYSERSVCRHFQSGFLITLIVMASNSHSKSITIVLTSYFSAYGQVTNPSKHVPLILDKRPDGHSWPVTFLCNHAYVQIITQYNNLRLLVPCLYGVVIPTLWIIEQYETLRPGQCQGKHRSAQVRRLRNNFIVVVSDKKLARITRKRGSPDRQQHKNLISVSKKRIHYCQCESTVQIQIQLS